MFGTIRRHQTWLWVVIAGLTILSFVAFGPTNTRIGNALSGGGGGNFGSIDDHPISQNQFLQARAEAVLDYLFRYRQWPDRDPQAPSRNFNESQATYQWIFLDSQMRKHGINVGTEAIADEARQVLNAFNMSSLDQFETQVLKPEGLSLADLDRFLRDQAGRQQLIQTLGLTGTLVTPQEAETLYRKEHQDAHTQMAYFAASNYLNQIQVTPAELASYYSNRQASYAIPVRVQVQYVKFDLSSYTNAAKAQITNLDAIVDEEALRFGTNLDRLAKTPELAKERIREEIIDSQALGMARKDASQFAVDLDNQGVTNLVTLAKARNLKVETTEPFSLDAGPKELDVNPSFAKTAFQLSPDSPIGVSPKDASRDAVYVMVYQRSLPSEIPALKDIENQVKQDYSFLMAGQMARNMGKLFGLSASNSISQGKSLATVVEDSKTKPQLIDLPPFSLSTQTAPSDLENRVSMATLKEAAFGTPVKQLSPFIPTRDGGFYLYVESVTPVSEATVKAELPEFLDRVRRAREYEAFNSWYGYQVQQDHGFAETLQSLQENRKSPRRRSS